MTKTNSSDLLHEELKKFAEFFPQFVSEGKVDIVGLQSYLDGHVIEGERYTINWHGKSKAKQIAREPSVATLRPDLSQSKNRDKTGNMLIEGDNLEVLKLLQNHYYEQIKCIYIDPPYNKDKDFVYSDTWKDPIGNYMRITGQTDDEGDITTDTETTGRKHSNWLSMMYPRLYLARKLLKDDGVIFVSIDDNEVANLKKLMDELFGEENFLCQMIWKSGTTSASHFTNEHEYILIYAKDKDSLPLFYFEGDDVISDRAIKKESVKNPASEIFFSKGIDFESEDKVFPNEFGSGEIVTVVKGIFSAKNGKLENDVILRAAWTMKDMIESWLEGDEVIDQKGQKVSKFFFKNNGILQYQKEKGTIHPKSIVSGFTTKNGTNEIKSLFGNTYFTFPKPSKLIYKLIEFVTRKNNNDIVLDFFAGSGTTGHAVMDLNAQDTGDRKYILVQLPEAIVKTQEAYKAGYRKISEITRDRLIKAGEKINKGDTGFKFFKLDTSNFAELDPITVKEGETTDTQLFDRLLLEADSFGIKNHRTDDDIITELLIRYGYSLHSQIAHDLEFPTWYKITDMTGGDKSFFLSLEDKVSDNDIDCFVKRYQNHNQTIFVCKDDAISSGSRLTLANYFSGFTTL